MYESQRPSTWNSYDFHDSISLLGCLNKTVLSVRTIPALVGQAVSDQSVRVYMKEGLWNWIYEQCYEGNTIWARKHTRIHGLRLFKEFHHIMRYWSLHYLPRANIFAWSKVYPTSYWVIATSCCCHECHCDHCSSDQMWIQTSKRRRCHHP